MNFVAAFYWNTVQYAEKMHQIWTFDFLKIVRQNILGVVGNGMHYLKEI